MGKEWRRTATLGMIGIAALASSCGGGSSAEGDGESPLEVTSRTFLLTGTESTTLDLTQRDVVLAAALASLSAGTNLRGVEYLDYDPGTPEPGAGRGRCHGGEFSEDAVDGIGVRDVLLEAFQCYFSTVEGESVLDGSVRVFKIASAGGHIEGNVEPGVNGRPLVLAVRVAGDAHFDFFQADALVDYEGDADEDQSSTVGGRLLFGDADVGPSDRVGFQKGIEIFAGPDGTAFQTQSTLVSDSVEQISVTGSLIYRGEGMDAPCNVTGRYAVATSGAITANFSEGDGHATGGSLALTSGAANATVAFLSNGDAVVTTANGNTTTYPSMDVDTHCGFDP